MPSHNNPGKFEKITPKVFAVLNLTPDSFSDGGKFNSPAKALDRIKQHINEGADVIDIGADSTRPGSTCVGPELEWQRLSDVLPEAIRLKDVSIDTHHSETAKKAIALGVKYINDVYSGYDPRMFGLVADSNVKIILTYTRCRMPHVFEKVAYSDLISEIKKFFESKIQKAFKAGIKREQIILDPGMGAFISDEKNDSFNLIENFAKLYDLNFPLMFSASRKGFLRAANEGSPVERDQASAELFREICERLEYRGPQYVRAHNVARHRQILF